MPRPPQFRRGVSCICTVSAGLPEVLGRSALTVIGSYALLACCLDIRAASAVLCTYPFVLRHCLCHSRQPLVVRPVYPAKLGNGVAYPQARRVCWTACYDVVDSCEWRLQSCRHRVECCLGLVCRPRVVVRLLCQACVMLVETLLDARHDIFVVVLQPYYARSRCSYYSANQR